MRRNRENFPIINYPARRRKIGWCKRIAGSRNLTKVWPANYFWPRPKACGLLGKLGKYLSIGGPTGYLPGKPNNLFPRFHLSFFSLLSSFPFPSLSFALEEHLDADTSKIGRVTRRQNVFRSVPLSRIVARNYVITILGLADGV